MSASAQCPHAGVTLNVEMTAMTDSNIRCLQIMAKCPHCDHQFLFVGAPTGVSLGRPTMSMDHSMLYVPMIPEGEQPPDNLPEMIARRVV